VSERGRRPSRRAGSSAGEHVRLFVAVDLPDPTRRALAGWAAARADEIAGLRLVPERSLHVTLCFLGWRPASDAGHVGRVALAAAGPVGEVEPTAGAWLPERRPRVLAVDLDDSGGRLAALQARVSEALAAETGNQPEKRPFRAHVTVARVRRGERVRPVALPDPPAGRFAPSALTLYRSVLQRSGAEYEPLARVEL
jgi:RNA 2',3'-cyclic 3'-phosphodiesterase